MSFIAPLFLAGAAAIALPILFHLIRRTIRDKQRFSSLMFLLPTPPKVTKHSRIENWLLLLLRCLVIACLALAFARPFFRQPVDSASGNNANRSTLVLIDSSASMQRESLWSQAISEAQKISREAGPNDTLALATFNQRLHPVISLEQARQLQGDARTTTFQNALANLKPTWENANLGSALQSASEWLDPRDGKDANGSVRRIIVISDLADGSRLDGLQGYEWPKGTEVELHPLKVSKPTNAGITLLPGRLDEDDLTSQVRVRIVNAAESKREQFILQLSGGVSNGTQRLDVYVPPGQNRVLSLPVTGLTPVTLELTGDDAPFDNLAHWVPPTLQTIRVLILSAAAPTDPNRPPYYIQRAFTSTRRQSFDVVTLNPATTLSQDELNRFALVIVAADISPAWATALRATASTGKPVLFTLPSASATTGLAAFLQLNSLPAQDFKSSTFSLLGDIDFKHPLLAPFADSRFNDFTKIHFWKHRVIRESDLPDSKAVMRFDSGDPAFLDVSKGPLQAYVLTTTWAPDDSQLALSTKFVPLLYSILEKSSGWQEAQEHFTVGDPIRTPAGWTNQITALKRPDGSAWNLTFTSDSSSPNPAWDAPGIFTLPDSSHRFAVGLNSDESRTTPITLETFEKLGVPLSNRLSKADEQKALERKHLLAASELENRQKLWRWILGLTLVILLMETWLAGWISRRQSPATPA